MCESNKGDHLLVQYWVLSLVKLHVSVTNVNEYKISFSYQKAWYHQKEEVSHELFRDKFWFEKKDKGEYVWNKPDYWERAGKETPEATEITLGHGTKKWDEKVR
jgi:hypothetical protein